MRNVVATPSSSCLVEPSTPRCRGLDLDDGLPNMVRARTEPFRRPHSPRSIHARHTSKSHEEGGRLASSTLCLALCSKCIIARSSTTQVVGFTIWPSLLVE